MGEEKDYIELIDKYISGEMSQEELDDFEKLKSEDQNLAQELLIFEKLYDGIEKKQDEELRGELDSYYQSFLSEQNSNPFTLRRWILIAGGIAAVFIVGFLFLWEPTIEIGDGFQVENIENEPAPLESDVPVEPEKEEVDGPIKESPKIEKETWELGTVPKMAIGGTRSLSKERIRAVQYPQILTYTFDGRNLKIFGDPLLIPLRLAVFRSTNGQFYLKNGEEFLRFGQTDKRVDFEIHNESISSDIESDETVVIHLMPIISISTTLESLEVKLTESKTEMPAYTFNKNELVVFGGYDPEKTEVFRILMENEVKFILLSRDKLYELDPSVEKITRLFPVNDSPNSSLNLLVKGRGPIELSINQTGG